MGIKGHYDSVRPVSAIRYMASKGQCTDPNLPSYHPEGLALIPGFVELIYPGDPLAGYKMKIYIRSKQKSMARANIHWQCPDRCSRSRLGIGRLLVAISTTNVCDTAICGLYIRSLYLFRAAAEVMEKITGSPYFPGGLGEFVAKKNEYLVFEDGHQKTSNYNGPLTAMHQIQSSLSRIWGSIHPRQMIYPAGKMELKLLPMHLQKRSGISLMTMTRDGYLSIDDCDDNNANVHPGRPKFAMAWTTTVMVL